MAESKTTDSLAMNPHHSRRRRQLLRPGFQLRLIASFVGLAAMALLLQFLLLGFLLSRAVSGMEGAGALADQIPVIVIQALVFSMTVLLPLIFLFGVRLTFRIAGPISRFESYLGGVARGDESGPCRIRRGDELHSLCDAINAAMDATGNARTSEDSERDEPARISA